MVNSLFISIFFSRQGHELGFERDLSTRSIFVKGIKRYWLENLSKLVHFWVSAEQRPDTQTRGGHDLGELKYIYKWETVYICRSDAFVTNRLSAIIKLFIHEWNENNLRWAQDAIIWVSSSSVFDKYKDTLFISSCCACNYLPRCCFICILETEFSSVDHFVHWTILISTLIVTYTIQLVFNG